MQATPTPQQIEADQKLSDALCGLMDLLGADTLEKRYALMVRVGVAAMSAIAFGYGPDVAREIGAEIVNTAIDSAGMPEGPLS